ncbi:MAG: hypothetical protein V2G48_05470 [bacterium JZ-2024 1]
MRKGSTGKVGSFQNPGGRARTVLALFGCFLFLSPPLWGVSPFVMEYKTYNSLKSGESRGIMISPNGKLILGPACTEKYSDEGANLWSLAVGKDAYFLGTGEKKIIKVPFSGEARVFGEVDEALVFALTVDGKGNVYAGTSPDGKVYRFSPDGKREEYARVEAKYIWALAWGPDGKLLVATGVPAKLLRVDSPNKTTVLFTSPEKHFRSLLVSKKGEIFVGSSDSGIIYKVEKDGKGYGIVDTPYEEIVGLSEADGGIYVLAGRAFEAFVAPYYREGLIPPEGGETPPPGTVLEGIPEGMMPSETIPREEVPRAKRGGLVFISDAGWSTTLWELTRDTPFSLSTGPDGSALVGTGDSGIIYWISPRGEEGLFSTVQDKQVIGMTPVRDGRMLLLTFSSPRLIECLFSTLRKGEYQSPTVDAGAVADWGKFSASFSPPSSAKEIQVRGGNTQNPDSSWTDWTAVSGGKISLPPTRYLQWRIVLEGEKEETFVSDVMVAALPRNQPPQITSLTIAGEPSPAPAGGERGLSSSFPEVSDMMGPEGFPSPEQVSGPVPGMEEQPPRVTPPTAPAKGVRSISWKASDPNKDKLEYSLYYRLLHQKNWKLLKEKLTTTRYSWDTTAFPDGIYVLRLVASDAPSNPRASALSTEFLSQPVIVDNSPPILSVSGKWEKNAFRVSFTATDSFSRISSAYYSLNGGDWVAIPTVDGVPDSLSEDFSFLLENLSGEENSVMLKVSDARGNTAYQNLDIPPR